MTTIAHPAQLSVLIYDEMIATDTPHALLNTKFPADMLARAAYNAFAESHMLTLCDETKAKVVQELTFGINLIRREVL